MTAVDLKAWRMRLPVGTRQSRPGPSPTHATQPEAASILGVSLRTYQNWEQGHRKIPDSIERETDRIEEYAEEPD